MKSFKLSLLVSVAFFMAIIFSRYDINAQDLSLESKLVGLTKAPIPPLRWSIEGDTIPVYTSEGKNLKGTSVVADLFKTGNYRFEFWVDDNDQLKATVLQMATQEEKEENVKREARREEMMGFVGTTAKPFSVSDMNGNKYSLDSLRGKIVVVNFWFIGCKPCIEEMPELNGLVDKYSDDDMVFLAFANDGKPQLENFLSKKEFNYQIIPWSREIAQVYNVSAYPTHMVIDHNSNISYIGTGFGSKTVEVLDGEIGQLLKIGLDQEQH